MQFIFYNKGSLSISSALFLFSFFIKNALLRGKDAKKFFLIKKM